VYIGQGKLATIKNDPTASKIIALAGEVMVIITKKAREGSRSASQTTDFAGKESKQNGRKV